MLIYQFMFAHRNGEVGARKSTLDFAPEDNLPTKSCAAIVTEFLRVRNKC